MLLREETEYLQKSIGDTKSPEKMSVTKAYVVNEKGGPFTLEDVVLDELQPDEVLVEMSYTGLCHTVSPTGSLSPWAVTLQRACLLAY
jgi:hypothetical protein